MKPVEVKNNTYIYFGKNSNDKDPKFKINDYVRISKPKNIFAISFLVVTEFGNFWSRYKLFCTC